MFCTQIIKHIPSALRKPFSTSTVQSAYVKVLKGTKWRIANGYPENLTARGVLTDGPDYTNLDGTPTPYTSGQRARLFQQREYGEKIQKLLSIVENSKKRYQEKVAADQKQKEQILGRKLRPKGKALKNTSL